MEAVWLPVKTAVNSCFAGQLRATEKGEFIRRRTLQ